jgi:general secretion pathway protein J
MSSPVNSRGFTLLEMVVSIGIFAIIAAISYSALNGFLDARAHLNSQNDRLRALQTMFVLLEQDLRYAVNRTVRDEYGDAEPAFAGNVDLPLADGERLRLSTVRPAPVGGGRHQLERVAWRLIDGALYRVSWRVLDRDIDSEGYSRRVMDNIDDIGFRYFGFDGGEELRVYSEWTDSDSLPVGVEVTVLPEGEAEYQRIFEMAGGQ